MKSLSRSGVIAIATLVAGCMHMAPAYKPPAKYELTSGEISLLHGRLNGASQPRVSLAMSGGGIRSSLFNYGVLKALYDAGILDDVDVVSSVSGGSYLTYRLFTEQLRHPTARFGEPLFDDAVFAQSLCNVTAHANFVTWPQMFAYAPLTPFWWSANRQLYENGLAFAFGRADPNGRVRLQDLVPMVRNHRQPYLITNATTYGRYLNSEPWPRRAFEFTPLHHGSFESHRSWDEAARPSPQGTLAYATLASGAANRVLKRRFDVPFADSAPDTYVYLWDGGKSDNLGAVAPLMRGTKNLIVVDAQFDGAEEVFGAYYTLQARMANFGEAVTIMRDPSASLGTYSGRVTGGQLNTHVQYIKMEKPAALMTNLRLMTDRLPKTPDGADIPPPSYEAYASARGEYLNDRWECKAAPLSREATKELMEYNVASYLGWVEYPSKIRQAIRRDYPLIGSAVRHDFPETTTVDQSLYMDQALAYVGLGYSSQLAM